jgi:hypothetical protein
LASAQRSSSKTAASPPASAEMIVERKSLFP